MDTFFKALVALINVTEWVIFYKIHIHFQIYSYDLCFD